MWVAKAGYHDSPRGFLVFVYPQLVEGKRNAPSNSYAERSGSSTNPRRFGPRMKAYPAFKYRFEHLASCQFGPNPAFDLRGGSSI